MKADQHGHDHGGEAALLACSPQPADEQTGKRLAFAAGLTAAILVAEIVGGLLTHSLALLSDAAHVFSDVLALLLSYGAYRLARRPPSLSRTYGWHRAEVLAGLANGSALVLIGIGIIREAWERFVSPPEVQAGVMLLVAVGGLVANAIVLLRLGGHGHRDLNLRSAYLHVLGDLLASIGVVVAGIVMRLTGQYIVDPLLSVAIALAVIFSSLRLIHEAVHILLEGVPRGIELEDIVSALEALPEVLNVHHVHVWSLCSNVHALSAHLCTTNLSDEQRHVLRAQALALLGQRFGIAEATLQLETDCLDRDHLLHAAAHGETLHRGQ